MNIYYTILNGLLLLSFAILLRYSWYRFRFFLHMFQLQGYKTNEYKNWISGTLFSRVVTTEHILMNIIIAALLYLMSDRMTLTAAALILGMFTLFWFGPVSAFRADKEKKPLVFTPRMIRLSVTLGLIISFLIYVIADLAFTGRFMNTLLTLREMGPPLLIADPYFLIFGLIFVDILIPFLLFPAAFLMKPVENHIHKGFKKKARKKLAGLPDLKIIAITGSYGKTSTKFMIDALLGERLSVCTTPGSYNTPMGICKVINNDLEARHQVLILEMGARYEGNIRELCNIAKPDIAVITNVGKAHLETFGSIETIAKEKSTLAIELKRGGLLVLNSDDENVKSMSQLRDDVNIVTTGLESGEIRAERIDYGVEGTRFDLCIHEKAVNGKHTKHSIQLKLLGVHNVQNFLLAVAVARNFGIRAETIMLAAKQIQPVEHRLELKKEGGLYIIDDAFNSNPVGARNAVDILSSFKTGRRIIVTPGMIELGDIQEQENKAFGQHIAQAGLDLVILVGPEQTRPILEGIRNVNQVEEERIRIVNSLFEANEIIKEFAQSGDVILYENDLPDTFNE